MSNIKSVITNSSLDTEELGEEFAKELSSGDIVCLYGDLGSGKTTFTKGIAKGLGIKSRIISPTFILMRKHSVKIKNQRSNIKNLYHIDLYRLESENDVNSLGLEEVFDDDNAVVIIEWAEKSRSSIKKCKWEIKFEDLGEEKRKIIITEN